ncbi:MAG: acyl-ACP--UDP-N-acetylglucosamine O-acyltransferase [Gammaproteobacteria bacterium]|jgi:UDP-N-acetylglucosamine acyltransferase
MSNIHPTAIIEEGATLDPSVSVGPFSIIESGAVIGPDCIIESSVRIYSPVRMGTGNRVCHGAALGCEPQDLSYTPEKSKPIIIGNHNHFKEYVNISRGVKTAEGTIIGDHNYFMSGFHAGHDVIIGNHNILTSNAVIGGHVVMGDRVFVSGLVAIHQFVNIGDYAMIAGCSKVTKDIPPYTTADGNPARIVGLNTVGLRRAGFSLEARKAIKKTYQTIYHSDLNISQALAVLEGNIYSEEEERITAFFLNSERGVTAHR